MRSIHKRMLGGVWTWAGDYRVRETDIGVPWHQITERVKELVDTTLYQISIIDDLPWTPDELAVRFHHRLVSIHPFPNGNGRHARMCADIRATAIGRPAFRWGGTDLGNESDQRHMYLDALRVADLQDDFESLVAFARS